MNNELQQIDQLKIRLDQHRPFPPEVVENLRKYLIVEWTYHSNSIEGNTLTKLETKVVLEDGITIGGRSVREHLEAINHKEAILLLEDLIRNKEDFSERVVKDLHAIVLRGIDTKNAGIYRKSNVVISGASHIPSHIPPDPLFIEEHMHQLFHWYHHEAKALHPVERAAILHSLFVKVHPFIDGNGRTARLLLNLELMKSGFPPIIIKTEQRLEYYKALDKSHMTEEYHDFINFVSDLVNDALQFYLGFLN